MKRFTPVALLLAALVLAMPGRIYAQESPDEALLAAASAADADALRRALNAGADPNAEDDYRGYSALSMLVDRLERDTVTAGDLTALRMLLQAGAKPNTFVKQYDDTLSVLYYAVYYHPAAVVQALLEAGADPNAVTSRGDRPLPRALARREYEKAILLLDAGADPNLRGSGSSSPFCLVTDNYYEDRLIALVQRFLAGGADPNVDDCAPLVKVAGDPEEARVLVPLLLEAGADPDHQAPNSDTTALIEAAGDAEIVRLLLEAGADPDLATPTGRTALGAAYGEAKTLLVEASDPVKNPSAFSHLVTTNEVEKVRAALAAGADPDASDATSYAPLMWAAGLGHHDLVRLLLEAGANPDVRTFPEGHTPLMQFAVYGPPDPVVIEMLLAGGADPNAVDYEGVPTLAYVAAAGLEDLVRTLLDAGADPNARSPLGRSPLLAASEAGHPGVVRLLLDVGAEVDAQTVEDQTALTLALQGGHDEVATALKAAGANEERAQQGFARSLSEHEAALFDALDQNDEGRARQALRDGADPNARNERGCTPLVMLLLRCGGQTTIPPVDTVESRPPHPLLHALLEAGADLNKPDAHGRTPLMAALAAPIYPEALALLEAGAEVHAQDWNGQTALLYALPSAPIAVLERLLKAGADPNHVAFRGQRPLYYPVNGSRPEVLRLLLAHGATDLNKPYPDGSTNLHGAVRNAIYYADREEELQKSLAVVRILLDAGADPEAEHRELGTPLLMARESGLDWLIEMLEGR